MLTRSARNAAALLLLVLLLLLSRPEALSMRLASSPDSVCGNELYAPRPSNSDPKMLVLPFEEGGVAFDLRAEDASADRNAAAAGLVREVMLLAEVEEEEEEVPVFCPRRKRAAIVSNLRFRSVRMRGKRRRREKHGTRECVG